MLGSLAPKNQEDSGKKLFLEANGNIHHMTMRKHACIQAEILTGKGTYCSNSLGKIA